MRNGEMDVFSVEENEDAAKRENGIYWPPPHTHVQHECSKTESEQKLEVSGGGVLHSIKDQNGTYTKELIAEIELLEEEVTNREQHVLSMYRCIFENCVSQAPSDPNSGVASPAHTKQVSRKHPSIISSAFCSSKKLPLRPLQALVSIRESAKISSKASDAPSFLGKSDIQFEKTFDCVRAEEQIHVMEKSSMLRTLKDHLYQCPSKLSEEMVRCMAAVYCWLHSTASVPGKNRSPLLSRSSTNLVIPRHDIGQDRDWSCKSTVEISWKSTDRSQLSSASYAINNYSSCEANGEGDCSSDGKQCPNCFLDQCAYLAYGIPRSSLRRLALFHKAAYNIGSHISSANAIEQSIFGFRTPELERGLRPSFPLRCGKNPVKKGNLLVPSLVYQMPNP
uniref:Ternary complex factor MIP1 leucine-zipper domain-containing protein n=1 Tax=Manihot esculenta TaxID=3983 RepID=A0A2C9WC82_MANES